MTNTTRKKPQWIIPFGKHKGKPLSDIPTSYLEFLTEQDWFLEKFRPAAELIGAELHDRFLDKNEAQAEKERNNYAADTQPRRAEHTEKQPFASNRRAP